MKLTFIALLAMALATTTMAEAYWDNTLPPQIGPYDLPLGFDGPPAFGSPAFGSSPQGFNGPSPPPPPPPSPAQGKRKADAGANKAEPTSMVEPHKTLVDDDAG